MIIKEEFYNIKCDCYDYDDDLNIVTKDGRRFDGDTEEEITGNETR